MNTLRRIVKIIALVFILGIIIDFFRFPDCYLNTWKYQLQEEIQNGNEQSIKYYQEHYLNKGRELFINEN